MKDRQTKAVAEAIAASIYHSEGLETINYAGVEDYCKREWHHYEEQAQAAIAASDAGFVPALVNALKEAVDANKKRPPPYRTQMPQAEAILSTLPEEYRK